MEFCDFCENMLYIKCSYTDDNKYDVMYHCKNCDSIKELPTNSITTFAEKNFDTTVHVANDHFMNSNIEFDHTIPHVNNIVCPNIKCTKEPNVENDVMYVKTDPIKLSFSYYCVHCKHFWKNS
jgi:DNA-directed RNA polymerase subunit M/transcription elongation factor TFIIS